MRFLASFTIANAAESQRRMRELADRDRQVRQRPQSLRALPESTEDEVISRGSGDDSKPARFCGPIATGSFHVPQDPATDGCVDVHRRFAFSTDTCDGAEFGARPRFAGGSYAEDCGDDRPFSVDRVDVSVCPPFQMIEIFPGLMTWVVWVQPEKERTEAGPCTGAPVNGLWVLNSISEPVHVSVVPNPSLRTRVPPETRVELDGYGAGFCGPIDLECRCDATATEHIATAAAVMAKMVRIFIFFSFSRLFGGFGYAASPNPSPKTSQASGACTVSLFRVGESRESQNVALGRAIRSCEQRPA